MNGGNGGDIYAYHVTLQTLLLSSRPVGIRAWQHRRREMIDTGGSAEGVVTLLAIIVRGLRLVCARANRHACSQP